MAVSALGVVGVDADGNVCNWLLDLIPPGHDSWLNTWSMLARMDIARSQTEGIDQERRKNAGLKDDGGTERK